MEFLRLPIVRFGICLILSFFLWHTGHLFPVPEKGWQVFSIFLPVIVAFILRPFPIGMMVLVGLISLVVLRVISLEESLSGYADTTVWLVVSAFLIAGAVVDTGFGRRIALLLVKKMGKSITGLGYAICVSEFLLGPFIPSNTARGGGIHSPIVNSLSHSLGSSAEKNPKIAGQFLSLIGAHANLITAAMFLTAMAANPLVSRAVREIYNVEFGWTTWALGSIVPGIVSLSLLPIFMYKLAPPLSRDGSAAQKMAASELNKLGPLTYKEKWMIFVMLFMILLWATKFIHGIGTTTVALIGVLILQLSKTQSWNDIISNIRAWDTLVWLGGLLTMANMLLDYGFIDWFVSFLENFVSTISGIWVVLILGIIYFYSMYAFSMLTAHIAAMAFPFLAVCYASSVSPYLAAAIFAYFSCLCGCMTNYSSGPIIIYFGLGYVEAPKWFSVGFLISIFHVVIWYGIGLLWWKILGWW